MERTLCAALASRLAAGPGPATALTGWVTSARRFGGLCFLVLRDRSGSCQCVLEPPLQPPARESIVTVRGVARPEPRAPGGVELAVTALQTLVAPAQPPPFALDRAALPAALDTVLAHRAAALRHPAERAVFEVQAALLRGFRRHLDGLGFCEVHSPKLVGGATEGGAEVFAVDYFGQRAYLAQSPQLYKQLLVAAGFERVYEVGPVYRAEPHATARHLSEYVSLDLETELFAGGGTRPLLDLQRGLLTAMFAQVEADAGPALRLLRVPALPAPARAAVLTLQEALGLTGRAELDPEGERLLGERVGEAVFVTDWPVPARPFYAMAREDAPALTHSFDLILRGLEVSTGGQREHRAGPLRQALRSRGLEAAGFDFYLEAFELGAPPHGGFALGLERLTARLLGLPNVRRASLFPRDRQRLLP